MVALEMLISGDWIVPTIRGEYYYNKPVLYNWLLAGLFKLTGSTSELVVRLPAIVPLFLFGATIFWWVRKNLDGRTGFFAAAAFVTCGRLALYDSWLGHIDLFFSWIVFLSFIAIYEGYKRERWYLLFVVAYLLAAIGVLTKLISVVFLGGALLAWFTTERRFLKLFHPAHFVGLGVLVLVVGGYFYAYDARHPIEQFLEGFLNNNTERTALVKSALDTVLYALSFPFEQLYHLLPWSLFVVFLFKKGSLRNVWKQPFLRFCIVVLLINLLPYWFSPDTRPRYLFAVYPLLLIVLGHAFFAYRDAMPKVWNGFRMFWIAVLAVVALGVWALPFVELPAPVEGIWLKAALLSGAFGVCLWLYVKLKQQGYVMVALAMILVRMAWNVVSIPDRMTNGPLAQAKADMARVLDITQGEPVFGVAPTGLNHEQIWYLQSGNRHIMADVTELQPNTWYITHRRTLTADMEVYFEFRQRYQNRECYLVKLRQ